MPVIYPSLNPEVYYWAILPYKIPCSLLDQFAKLLHKIDFSFWFPPKNLEAEAIDA